METTVRFVVLVAVVFAVGWYAGRWALSGVPAEWHCVQYGQGLTCTHR